MSQDADTVIYIMSTLNDSGGMGVFCDTDVSIQVHFNYWGFNQLLFTLDWHQWVELE